MKEVQLDEKDLRRLFISQSPWAKFLRFSGRMLRKLIVLGLVFLVFYWCINFAAFSVRLNYSLNPPEPVATLPEPAPVPTPQEPEPLPDYAPELKIAKLGISAPILLNVFPDDVIPSLVNGVAHLASTALPGQVGNTVIFGHSSDFPWKPGNYKNIFALLDKLSAGDEIQLPYKTQQYVFKVTGSKVVSPSELSMLKRTPNTTLTLITCYPVGSTRSRLIITAELASGQTTGPQLTEPDIGESIPTPR